MTRLSAALSCNVSPLPSRPETEPPTVKTGPQTTCIVVTLTVAGPVPLVIAVLKLKATVPVPLTVRLSLPLSSRTSPLPWRPITDPPMLKGPVPPEPEPEPEPEPDPEPEPEPEPEPVVPFRPLHELRTSAAMRR